MTVEGWGVVITSETRGENDEVTDGGMVTE